MILIDKNCYISYYVSGCMVKFSLFNIESYSHDDDNNNMNNINMNMKINNIYHIIILISFVIRKVMK